MYGEQLRAANIIVEVRYRLDRLDVGYSADLCRESERERGEKE